MTPIMFKNGPYRTIEWHFTDEHKEWMERFQRESKMWNEMMKKNMFEWNNEERDLFCKVMGWGKG